MATETTYYSLTKPDEDELYNVLVFNANADTIDTTLYNKVDKIEGKSLSTNDYTTNEKNKLGGIESGAEVNVQADWNITSQSNDAYIKNKPTKLSQFINDPVYVKTIDTYEFEEVINIPITSI